MLVYPSVPSPSDLMPQLVPCSWEEHGELLEERVGGGGGGGFLYDGQVPSPSLSAYWSEANRSPALYHASSPPPAAGNVPGLDSTTPLEELLNEYTYYDQWREPDRMKKSPEHALLRRCLERHPPSPEDLQLIDQLASAIVFPQFDMKTEKVDAWSDNNSSSGSSPSAGLASVLSLVMEQIHEEVRSTCQTLHLSPNPSAWSSEDVKGWLLWTSRQCNLGPLPLHHFHVDGSQLVALTEEEFRAAAPQGGDVLYAKLDIWRSAWNQRSHVLTPAPTPTTTTPPSIRVEDTCPDVSEMLLTWNSTAGSGSGQQEGLLGVASPSSNYFLTVPSPASSFHRGRASPYSDHTPSSCEDFTSEVEEMEEEEEEEELRRASTPSVTTSSSHIHLWQFLKELLSQTDVHGSAIRWLDRSRGVFKIEDSVRVARLWGKRKNRPAMNYDKLSRSIRQYYRKGIMKKTERSQRLVYQFCHPYAL